MNSKRTSSTPRFFKENQLPHMDTKVRGCGNYPLTLQDLLGGDESHGGGGADPATGRTPGGQDGSDKVRGDTGDSIGQLEVGGGRGGLVSPSPRPPRIYSRDRLGPDNPV